MNTTKLLSLLRTCVSSKSLKQGKHIHQRIVTLGLQNNVVLCKNVIDLYVSGQYYQHAKLVLKSMENPLDLALWNGLIAACSKNHMFIDALEVYEILLQHPYLKPDFYTYPSVLKAYGELGNVVCGKKIHNYLIKSGLISNVVVASSLVRLYAKCNVFDSATKLFDEMPERDVASWNNVISCYYQAGHAEKALEYFRKMRDSGIEPNSVTLTTAISSCARLLEVERGMEIHMEMLKDGRLLDGYVRSALVDMYGKCGFLEIAKQVFEQIPAKNVVTWNSMIAGYSLKGESKTCFELFNRMQEEGIKPTLTTLNSLLVACSRSAQHQHGKLVHGYIIRNHIAADIYIYSLLIELYFKCGTIQSAENVFEMMPKSDAIASNVMINGYVTVGNYFAALSIFEAMKEAGVKPDAITFTSILPACSQLAALEMGKEIHDDIVESKYEKNEIVMGAVLDMYAKCGAVDEAVNVFNQLPEKDHVSWTSMITAYASHGQASEALKLFGEMQESNVKPDQVTFLAVLSACSHGGMVDEGCYYFNQMVNDYGISCEVEHYSCLIDVLGRAGRLSEAYEILKKTPEITEDVDLLSTLLSACSLHGNLELGEEIGKLLIGKDPDEISTYVVLSNMYASAKKWDKVRKVRIKMRELGLKKNPGCSWIEIDKKIQPFFVEDKLNQQSEMVYECLAVLSSHMETDDLLPPQQIL
ncbi:pentatricopeptide repeat-containing protein [Tripterygium wilfordii]|uniref:Pentatricopeptide repeat-containing protein n=1 Tax=Tripterygium wilfordii TaxID=458696 RepID=A0A7J7DNM1_TRIWF|nr:pentatricopeptide repeat-containing protein At5g27110 [Tripterygium wilfordii]XP_038702534.1 pentatricopeptide repeat-containing protein At5g27110 [Tripterygium wilfordii]XP_038702535.1 pentatricopeptide repeat-containing protein At5g27110 [Tripterygium wilfordii]XP_038702536.1 pentatricopeptide repeat-containing protein At5g27110 [Tripterygium wilfordii]KAF5747804.1 pentatricopeptide repeat-containing protein [Tripterygium wilfordii]